MEEGPVLKTASDYSVEEFESTVVASFALLSTVPPPNAYERRPVRDDRRGT